MGKKKSQTMVKTNCKKKNRLRYFFDPAAILFFNVFLCVCASVQWYEMTKKYVKCTTTAAAATATQTNTNTFRLILLSVRVATFVRAVSVFSFCRHNKKPAHFLLRLHFCSFFCFQSMKWIIGLNWRRRTHTFDVNVATAANKNALDCSFSYVAAST